MIFEKDLDTGFFESEGFNESLYRNNFMRRLIPNHIDIETIDLTVEDIASEDQHMDQLHETPEERRQDSITIIDEEDDSYRSNEPLDINPVVTSRRGGNSRSGGNSHSRRGNSHSRRGNSHSRRGSNNHSRRGNNSNSNTRSSTGSGRSLRNRNQQNNDWNVLLPENMENQIRITRNRRRQNNGSGIN